MKDQDSHDYAFLTRLISHDSVSSWSQYMSQEELDCIESKICPQESESESESEADERSSVLEHFPELSGYLSSQPIFPPVSSEKKTSWSRDEWKRGHQCWIRVHDKPRRALFAPTGTTNGPDLSTLSGERFTKVAFLQSSGVEVITDDWLTVPTQNLLDREMDWQHGVPFEERIISCAAYRSPYVSTWRLVQRDSCAVLVRVIHGVVRGKREQVATGNASF